MSMSEKLEMVPKSLVRDLFDRASRMRDAVNLSIGEPDFDTPLHIKKAAKEALDSGLTKYAPTQGISELREAISEKFLRENGINASPDEILVSVSASQLIFYTLASLLREGDEVLIQSPMFVSYAPQVKITGGTPVEVKTREEEGFILKVKLLEEYVTPRTKCLIINSPSNPTGAVIPKENLEEIAKFVRENNLTVISDEIYEKLIYEGVHTSIASFPGMKDHVVTINGFSKSYAMTGWRLGYVKARKDIMEKIVKLTMYSTACAPTFVQKAALAAMTADQGCVEEMRREYDRRRLYFTKRLCEIEGISAVVPRGAFYIFPHIGGTGMNGMQFSHFMLEAGVVVVPGIAFGDWKENVRMCFAVSLETLAEAAERMERALRKR